MQQQREGMILILELHKNTRMKNEEWIRQMCQIGDEME